MEKSFLVFPHSTEPRIPTRARWNDIFHCGNVNFFMKYTNNFLMNNKYMLSHKSNVLLYLNDINTCIKHLDMFWNIWNFILWIEAGKKRSRCSYDSKYGALIPGKSGQQFKIQYHFGIFDTVIGEGQWYDDS